MNTVDHTPALKTVRLSERFILIALLCSLAIHVGVAVFKLDLSKKPAEKPKPLTVSLVQKAAPVVQAPKPAPPKPVIKPQVKPKVKPKKKPVKKQVIKKRKPVVKKVVKKIVKPALVPTPSPVVVAEPVYTPLPAVAPEPEPVIVPIAEPIAVPQPTPTPVVATPPPAGPSAAEINAAKGAYKRLLQRSINRHKKYPRIAKSRGWQGKVIIQFNLDRSGNILSKSVVQSSGYKALDKAALTMAEKAAPFPKPPEILQGNRFNIKVPIPFKLAPP